MFRPDAPRLKACLANGPARGAHWFSLGSPALVEISVGHGADAVVIDLQHGLWDRAGLEAAVGGCPPEVPCLVRVEDDSDAAIARALDSGAEGVLLPMIETAEQAARAAAGCHYPPDGRRSAGGIRTLARFADYRAGARAAVTVGVMIETAAAAARAEAIAAAPLVDFVFVGTGDLALSLGGDVAAVDDACAAILGACRAAGKPCGAFTPTLEAAARRAAEGHRFVIANTDVLSAHDAARTAGEAWRAGFDLLQA
jgi:2-keto-3-deoxy-L-rhamnonate aldolase RhmA